jgi:sulfane dehydrogenase subunit SoxC
MADGTARIFTFEMDAKSVVTAPSGGQKIASQGFYEIRGLAWSGRGRIDRVEVTLDGGKTWKTAQIDEVRYKQAFTRFRLPWLYDGKETVIASRATDETGYVQPTREELVTARGENSQYHYNGVKFWKVAADGSVSNA